MFDILLKIFLSVTFLAMPLMFLSATGVNPRDTEFHKLGGDYEDPKKGQRVLVFIAIMGQIFATMFVLELWNLVDFF